MKPKASNTRQYWDSIPFHLLNYISIPIQKPQLYTHGFWIYTKPDGLTGLAMNWS